jgi:hypothetical protein
MFCFSYFSLFSKNKPEIGKDKSMYLMRKTDKEKERQKRERKPEREQTQAKRITITNENQKKSQVRRLCGGFFTSAENCHQVLFRSILCLRRCPCVSRKRGQQINKRHMH